ncbi:hypothetical protein Ciccas_012684 [Cichlidogyrus casuarinus]|uniref:Uncharacterized protein n=1 Tax=Cichlidogyrus casuarinus TaxID=1844966 RepID=A0ABD2PMN5_9PLAT
MSSSQSAECKLFHLMEEKPDGKILKKAKVDLHAMLKSVGDCLRNFQEAKGTFAPINLQGIIHKMFQRQILYPENYFFDFEKTQLNFCNSHPIRNSQLHFWEAKLLCVGMIFFRGLILGLLCQPIQSGFVSQDMEYSSKLNAETSFKIFATILAEIYMMFLAEAEAKRMKRKRANGRACSQSATSSKIDLGNITGFYNVGDQNKLMKKLGLKTIQPYFVNFGQVSTHNSLGFIFEDNG